MSISVEFKNGEIRVKDKNNEVNVSLSEKEAFELKMLPEDHIIWGILKKITKAGYELGIYSVPGPDSSAEIRAICLHFDKHGR